MSSLTNKSSIGSLQALVQRWNRAGRSLTVRDTDGFLLVDSAPIDDSVVVRVAPHLDRDGQVVNLEFWLGVKVCGWVHDTHLAHLIHVMSFTVDEFDQMELTDPKGRKIRIHACTDERDWGLWKKNQHLRAANPEIYKDSDAHMLNDFEEMLS